MNCCDNKNENENDGEQKMKHKGHLSHMLLMIVCCAAPLLILFFLPFISSNLSPTTRNSLIAIVPFICPIMMLFMMPMMMRGNKGKQTEQNQQELAKNEQINNH